MQQPLNSYGIVAYTWLNALGVRTYRDPELTPPWLLEGTGLRRAEGLPFVTHWGPVTATLPPIPSELVHHQSRCSHLLWAALQALQDDVRHAVARWGPERVALVIGSSTGGIDVTERVVALEHQGKPPPEDYGFDAVHPFGSLLELARRALGLAGPGYVVSTACSSSGKAIAAAQRLLEANLCDAVITGGADALCQMTLQGFAGLGILSEAPCRPFDVARDGISIGEGSALLLLDRAAKVPLRLLSAGESNDAFHTTAPHPEGLGARLALESALALAGLEAAQIDYVNAHGTGTRQNDSAEALALAAILGPAVTYSSTKDRVGHQLGAAGATEAGFCLDALLSQRVPGNRPETRVDPALAAPPVNRARAAPLRAALSNSFAFGGSNVAVALGTAPADGELERRDRIVPGHVWVEAVGFWAPGYPHLRALLTGAPDPELRRPPATLLPARARGRASLLTRMFAEVYEQIAPPERSGQRGGLPLVCGSALGEMSTTLALLDQLARGESLSPAGFQASVHNTAAGVISIALGDRSFSTALAAGADTWAMSLLEAMAWLSVHGGRVAVLVADEDSPTRLTRRAPYPAAGAALLLHRAPEPTAATLGRLDGLERHAPGTSDAGDDAAREELDRRLPGLAVAPASRGLPLLRALLERREGRYALGDRWSVRVVPVEADAC